MNTLNGTARERHHIERIPHETRQRQLTVLAVQRLTPHMQRIHFHSPELHDFRTAAADDHIKLYFDDPQLAGSKCRRDYTIRKFDEQEQILTIDFALHQAGPATAWAVSAKAGDRLEIAGPKKSIVVADDFDWYLLIADQTGLPALARRVEELRAGVPVTTMVLVDSETDCQHIETSAIWTPVWIIRGTQEAAASDVFDSALANYAQPKGDGYVWIAAEQEIVSHLKVSMLEQGQYNSKWFKASNYWDRHDAG